MPVDSVRALSRVASPWLVVVVLLATACAKSGDRLGGGEKVDFCGGYTSLDELPEPGTTDAPALARYADGYLRVLGRLDTKRTILGPDGDRHELPDGMTESLAAASVAMRDFRDAVRRSDSTTELLAAQARLAHEPRFQAADAAMARLFMTGCAR